MRNVRSSSYVRHLYRIKSLIVIILEDIEPLYICRYLLRSCCMYEYHPEGEGGERRGVLVSIREELRVRDIEAAY